MEFSIGNDDSFDLIAQEGREKVTNDIRRTLANLLGIDEDRIRISKLERGSIVVTADIESEEKEAGKVLDELRTAVNGNGVNFTGKFA